MGPHDAETVEETQVVTSPRFTDIVDWYDGRLAPQDAEIVQRSLDSGDARTRGIVEWLQTFRAAATALPLSTPPPQVRHNLRRAFDTWAAARPSRPGSPRFTTASLIFDSRRGHAIAGARSGLAQENAVHLAFASDETDVMLDMTPLGEDRMRIDGQVLPNTIETADVFVVRTLDEGETRESVDSDRLGRFCFPSIPDDTSELLAENDDLRVLLMWASSA